MKQEYEVVRNKLGIVETYDIFQVLYDDYGDKMPEDLKERLHDFQVSLRIGGDD